MTFRLQVQPNVPYRVWMRVKASPGEKEGTLFFVQYAGAADKAGKELCPLDGAESVKVRTARAGWTWLAADPLVVFKGTEGRLRITAGSGGAFDQIVLSPLRHLEKAPAEPVVPKPAK